VKVETFFWSSSDSEDYTDDDPNRFSQKYKVVAKKNTETKLFGSG